MKFLLLLFFSVLVNFSLFADRDISTMGDLFFKSRLIAHVKITSHTMKSFKVRVLDILHHDRTGIKEDDYLTVVNDFYRVCPATFPISHAENHDEALAFLTFYKGKWYLNQGEISFLKNDNAKVRFYKEGYDFKASLFDWKIELDSYFSTFKTNDKYMIINAAKPNQTELNQMTNLVALQYATLDRSLQIDTSVHRSLQQNSAYVEPPRIYRKQEFQDTNKIYDYLSPSPLTKTILDSVNAAIISKYRERYLNLLQIDEIAKAYYYVLIEKDGSVSEVKIVFSSTSEIEECIVDYYLNSAHHFPIPKNSKGQAVRYTEILLLRIEGI